MHSFYACFALLFKAKFCSWKVITNGCYVNFEMVGSRKYGSNIPCWFLWNILIMKLAFFNSCFHVMISRSVV
jgi:hypothetical protein